MTSPTRGRVGRAFVEIVGDTSKFSKDVERKINDALREVGLHMNFEPIVDAGGRGGATTGKKFAKEFEREAVAGVKSTGKRAAEQVVVSMAAHATTPGSRSLIFAAFAQLGAVAARAATGLGSGFLNFAEGFGGALMSVGSGLMQGFSQLMAVLPPTALIMAGLGVVIIPSLIGALVLLATTLVGLLGIVNAFPAALGVLAAALIPVVVGFQGFGEALGAIIENDPEKLAKAMKNLTPSARAVAMEFKTLMPFFRELRKIAQENLFAPLVGSLRDVFAVIGPEVRAGMQNVAGAFGELLDVIVRLGTTPAVKGFLRALFGSAEAGGDIGAVARIILTFAPAIEKLLTAFSKAGTAGLPIVVRMFETLAGFIEKIATATEEAVADGSFEEWLNDALEIGGLLKDILVGVFDVLKTMFDETKEGGKEFLRDMIQALKDLNEWLQSPEGKQALEELIRLANTFLEVLKLVASILGDILAFMARADATIDILLGKTRNLQGGIAKSVAPGILAGVKALAEGGMVTKPTFALVGESGPEAVVPLNNPQRAAQVMNEAGLLPLGSMMGAGGMVVQVWLGTKQITEILDQRVQRGNTATARALARGPRSAEA